MIRIVMKAGIPTYKRHNVTRLAKPYQVHDSTCLGSGIF
jgi:hypothetical protein